MIMLVTTLAACADSADDQLLEAARCVPAPRVHLTHADGTTLTNAEARTYVIAYTEPENPMWFTCDPDFVLEKEEKEDDAPMIPRICGWSSAESYGESKTMELRARDQQNVLRAHQKITLKVQNCSQSTLLDVELPLNE